ncbi:MAG: hypothetical protein DRO88_08750 [Promethearchaeia archaeon]|nr:MAG: hypothetical protein DRO88_08750 [Candidatus Lokiarchaeia archaeon]
MIYLKIFRKFQDKEEYILLTDRFFFDNKAKSSLWYRFIFKLWPKAERALDQTISKFNHQYHEKFLSFHNFPSYLMRSELTELRKLLKNFKKSLRWKRLIFPSIFKAIYLTLDQELKFLQQYSQNYLIFQKQKNQDFFSSLNDEQINAILINEKENILVAGPGSGKTRVIMDRVGFYSLKQEKYGWILFLKTREIWSQSSRNSDFP